MNSRINIFVFILAISLLGSFGYYFQDDVGRVFRHFLSRLQPCRQVITYSIDRLDPQFHITKERLLYETEQAEKIWESSINKQLFRYSPEGDLKISLIYDYRQEATDALKKLGIVINADKATYNKVKAEYDLLVSRYDKEKVYLEALVQKYNTDKEAYERDVRYWNSRGGAPKQEYNSLEQRRIDLNNQVAVINQTQDSLNKLAEDINSAAIVLNKLIADLNLQVNTYNTVGASTGKEFNEGEYVRNASGTYINIYQFDNEDKLLRVLAHEFGHALGLGHLDNPKAIMYYLNEGINEKLTADDLGALKNLCGIK